MPYADPAAKKAHDAEYREANRAKLRADAQARYHSRKAAHMVESAAWRAANPWRVKAITFANAANRRARRQGASGHLYARDLVGPLALPGRCFYCGDAAETWDHHYEPMCLGGPNAPENLRLTCHPCNRAHVARALHIQSPTPVVD